MSTPELKMTNDVDPEGMSTWAFLKTQFKPKGPQLTPFNVISGIIMLVGFVLIVQRFMYGLGAVTNLSQEFPWGIWIGFDVVTGVAFAGGAYVLTFVVYVLNVKKYEPIVRATVLNGLLAYMFYAGALLLDLGRPLHVINPIIGNSFGVSSVLFLVAWHFLLYMIAQAIEVSPAFAEWLGARRAHKILHKMTLGAVIFGISLSLLHQSGLGALFMMAKGKIHPLWYSEFIPLLFVISSVFAGLAMVIFEGSISHKVFHHRLSKDALEKNDSIVMGLAKISAGTMFVYFFAKIMALVHSHDWHHLATSWGAWFGVEMLGFVAVPMFLYLWGIKKQNFTAIKVAAVMTLLGIILNRLNISVIAFKWYAPNHYVPTWQEIVITLTIISIEIWVFRWITNRAPILSESPEWADNSHGHEAPKKVETKLDAA
ncbi:Ni/Fe-hydrogenase cytochrome b subunit [Myxococcota bacterium]|nr:Ni/Fe-hydrogenase cytochrome b subunit [Myxococcota bacterium]